nr:hypothetical protein [Streptomyces sp. SID7803]
MTVLAGACEHGRLFVAFRGGGHAVVFVQHFTLPEELLLLAHDPEEGGRVLGRPPCPAPRPGGGALAA